MTTVIKLQIACFLLGILGGFSYNYGLYAVTVLCGMAVAVAVVLIVKDN